MLRALLITAPASDAHVAALAEHLGHVPLSAVLATSSALASASAIASPHALQAQVDARLEDGQGAIDVVEGMARVSEGMIALVVPETVARAVVVHALEAPVAADRLAFDPGGYAEIEVRLDSPWTVNRLNDRCYEHPDSPLGIVRT